jgi:hypothetical protein
MRARFHIPLASALIVAAVPAIAPPGVADDARNCNPGAAGVDTLSPAGFAMRMSLLDFLVIQRALMTMQDERAGPVLERLRVQLAGQPKLPNGPDR